MSSADPTKRFNSLIRRLKAAHSPEVHPAHGLAGAPPEWSDPLVDELIFSFLLWETNSPHARSALRRLRENVVDYNELRVCLPDELSIILGDRYPRAFERAQRLRATLTDLYRREHAITLAHLTDAPKREARVYLESLDGMPAYVAARLILVSFGGHAFPVDDRLRDLLASEGVAETAAQAESVSGWLERHVRASDAILTYALLQAWSDEGVHRREKKGESQAPQPAKRKTRKPRAKSSG